MGILAYPDYENEAQIISGTIPKILPFNNTFFLFLGAAPRTLEQGSIPKGSEATLKEESKYSVLFSTRLLNQNKQITSQSGKQWFC